jgi:hypothetical protein
MQYQVMTKTNGIAKWRYVTLPTSDLHRARMQFQTIKRYNAGVLLLAANSLFDLAQLTQRLCSLGDETRTPTHATPYAVPAATIQRSWHDYYADSRWELERGPGGDHDEPYRFEPSTSEATRRVWARLLASASLDRRDCV